MITCPNCSTSLNDGTKFCTNCGQAIEPQNVQVAAEVAPVCTSCGATLDPGVKFCQSCGAAVALAGGVVVEEVAAAQAGVPTETAAPTTAHAQSAVAGPLHPMATAQGYRCPKCQAFLQPGSSFCAACGTQLASAVPYGAGPMRQRSSLVLPIIIAAVLVLGGGGFALWWFVFKNKSDATTTVSTSGTTGATTGSAGFTTGGPVDESAAVQERTRELFTAVWKGEGIGALYDGSAMGDEMRNQYPNRQSFETDFLAGMGGSTEGWNQLRDALDNIQVDTPLVSGDTATVAINFTITPPGKPSMTLQANAGMVKENGTWKLDLRGSMTQATQALLDFMGLNAIMRANPQGATTGGSTGAYDGSTGAATTGTSGEFEYTTGTTGMNNYGTTSTGGGDDGY